MSKERFVMKEQDESCTFRTYKPLLKAAREKANKEDFPLKMLMNAGVLVMLTKSKSELENILKKAEAGGEI